MGRTQYNGTSVAGASIAEMKIINVENLMEQEDAIAIEHQHTKYKKHTHAATEQHDTPENIVETKKEQHTHATNEQHVATVNINENEIVTEGALTKSGTLFHFPLENVIDIVERNDIDTEEMAQQLENCPILESVQPLSATTAATSLGSSTTTSSHEIFQILKMCNNRPYTQFCRRISI